MRKEQFKEMLKDVPEMTEQEKNDVKELLLLKPNKTIANLTNDELDTLEHDLNDTETYVELHKLQYGDNYEYAKTTINALRRKVEIEKEKRML